MNHFRRIGTLQEDFQKLGIKPTTLGLTDSAAPFPAAAGAEPLTEARLAKVRTTRLSSGDRAKARLAARKTKAKTNRQRRMMRKKASYKRRMQTLKKMKGDRTAGGRMRFRLVQGLERSANLLEGVDVRVLCEGKDGRMERAKLAETAQRIAALAGSMSRRFSVLETALSEEEASMGIPVMHSGSSYGWESGDAPSGSAPKTGDVTDYASNKPATAAPTGDKMEGEDVGEDPVPGQTVDEDDDFGMDGGGDLDGEGSTDCGDENYDMDSMDIDDEDDGLDESVVHESRSMDHECAAIRVEATELALNLQQDEVSMGQASDLLTSMAQYLGGGMKLYNLVVTKLTELGLNYVGQDNPEQAKGTIPNVSSEGTVIGDGMPDGNTALTTPQVQGGPKTGDAIDGAAGGGAAATESKTKAPASKPKAA